MQVRVIVDDDGDEIYGTVTVGGDPWQLFCDVRKIAADQETRSEYISMAKKAGYEEWEIEVSLRELGASLAHVKTQDFITIKEAVIALAALAAVKAETEAEHATVLRAGRALDMLFGGEK